jgi:hypothetical protein
MWKVNDMNTSRYVHTCILHNVMTWPCRVNNQHMLMSMSWRCAYKSTFLITRTTTSSCFKFSSHSRLYNDAFQLHSVEWVIGRECNSIYTETTCGNPLKNRNLHDRIQETPRRILPKKTPSEPRHESQSYRLQTGRSGRSRNWKFMITYFTWTRLYKHSLQIFKN